MRYWRSLLGYTQVHPFGFIEVLMLSLAMVLLLVWGVTLQWPYLVLSLSYAIGASFSVLVRNQSRLSQITAMVIIFLSLYSFTDLFHYL